LIKTIVLYVLLIITAKDEDIFNFANVDHRNSRYRLYLSSKFES